MASFPANLALNSADRVITGSFIFAFTSSLNACLSDMFTGKALAANLAALQGAFGGGLVLGAYLGGFVEPRTNFYLSGALFLVTGAYVHSQIDETLPGVITSHHNFVKILRFVGQLCSFCLTWGQRKHVTRHSR
jgi:MFS family permease